MRLNKLLLPITLALATMGVVKQTMPQGMYEYVIIPVVKFKVGDKMPNQFGYRTGQIPIYKKRGEELVPIGVIYDHDNNRDGVMDFQVMRRYCPTHGWRPYAVIDHRTQLLYIDKDQDNTIDEVIKPLETYENIELKMFPMGCEDE